MGLNCASRLAATLRSHLGAPPGGSRNGQVSPSRLTSLPRGRNLCFGSQHVPLVGVWCVVCGLSFSLSLSFCVWMCCILLSLCLLLPHTCCWPSPR